MSETDKPKKNSGGSQPAMLSEMVLSEKESKSDKGALVVPPRGNEATGEFSQKLAAGLDETEEQAKELGVISGTAELISSWDKSKQTVTDFSPVPYFIWRLSSYVLGKSGQINPVSEGLVFGLRRLLFAVASDELLGAGRKVNDQREALELAASDVIAASGVIYAVCRRLGTQQFERIWRPILDDALLRARIGYYVGRNQPTFGAGRGMLAGFAGRLGLAILIAAGVLDEARQALELLAAGKGISRVGLDIYGCDPLQVSALALAASGCGKDAAIGTAAYGLPQGYELLAKDEQQLRWLAALTICEQVRLTQIEQVPDWAWQSLALDSAAAQQDLVKEAKLLVRRGHSWGWLVS